MVANRRASLAALRANRDPKGRTSRPEISMDEPCVHVKHHKRCTWNEDGTLVQRPSGVGARLISVDAIMQDDRGETYGWVPGAPLHGKAGVRTGAYHGAMHCANFRQWMLTPLLPTLPAHARILCANAPYHQTLTEETLPQSSTKKAERQQWLQAHHMACDEWLLQPACDDVCRHHAPPPAYAIDRLVAPCGWDILRTPQDHPALQPIAQAWGIATSPIAETQTGDDTRKSVRGRLQPACDTVTPEVCQNLLAHVRQEEERSWHVDATRDAMWTANPLV